MSNLESVRDSYVHPAHSHGKVAGGQVSHILPGRRDKGWDALELCPGMIMVLVREAQPWEGSGVSVPSRGDNRLLRARSAGSSNSGVMLASAGA